MIDLYTWTTPNGRKVSIMLEECALPYKSHAINIGKDEQFTPQFIALNPNSKIPAITDSEGPDGVPLNLFESGAILILRCVVERRADETLTRRPVRERESISPRRRQLLFAGFAGLVTAVPAAAQQCRSTPRDQLGPFYLRNAPEQMELCASGSGGKDRLLVSGHVLGTGCKPLAGALVEIWHADANGDYSGFTRGKQDDAACLLRASIKTDAEGRYSFSTVAPAEYPGRPRHIHYRISHAAHATLVTQLYFARERGVSDDLVTTVQRDGKGVARATFDITLSRAA